MKERIQIRCLPTADEIARTAAAQLLDLLKSRRDLSAPFGIALSGGRIAPKLYESIVEAFRRDPASLETVHFFWADERCVPPTDPENNYAIAREHLLGPLKISAENVHRIRGEVDAEYAEREAEAELCRIMPLEQNGQPILDLIILGMGEDGHVASLFPEEDARLLRDDRVYRRVVAAKPPPQRISLGYKTIAAARKVWVLVSGSGKKDALERLFTGDESLPITRVIASRRDTLVLQDCAVPQ